MPIGMSPRTVWQPMGEGRGEKLKRKGLGYLPKVLTILFLLMLRPTQNW